MSIVVLVLVRRAAGCGLPFLLTGGGVVCQLHLRVVVGWMVVVRHQQQHHQYEEEEEAVLVVMSL
jgi:hypothetical protein